jgi:hypothetical protein
MLFSEKINLDRATFMPIPELRKPESGARKIFPTVPLATIFTFIAGESTYGLNSKSLREGLNLLQASSVFRRELQLYFLGEEKSSFFRLFFNLSNPRWGSSFLEMRNYLKSFPQQDFSRVGGIIHLASFARRLDHCLDIDSLGQNYLQTASTADRIGSDDFKLFQAGPIMIPNGSTRFLVAGLFRDQEKIRIQYIDFKLFRNNLNISVLEEGHQGEAGEIIDNFFKAKGDFELISPEDTHSLLLASELQEINDKQVVQYLGNDGLYTYYLDIQTGVSLALEKDKPATFLFNNREVNISEAYMKFLLEQYEEASKNTIRFDLVSAMSLVLKKVERNIYTFEDLVTNVYLIIDNQNKEIYFRGPTLRHIKVPPYFAKNMISKALEFVQDSQGKCSWLKELYPHAQIELLPEAQNNDQNPITKIVKSKYKFFSLNGETRWHLFTATAPRNPLYMKLRGDALKTAILLNLVRELGKRRLPSEVNLYLKSLNASEEYRILQRSQGLTTAVLSIFGKKTSSVQAWEEIIQEHRWSLVPAP